MTRPGSSVVLLDTPGAVSPPPVQMGTWFVAGLTNQGPVAPTLIQSLNQFINLYGPRVSYSVLYDSIEEFFREGGGQCYIARVVGPGAVVGTVNLPDSGAVVSLIANANGPGAWTSGYTVVVYSVPGGGFGIQTLNAGVVVEDSGPLASQSAAVLWSAFSNYLTLVAGPSTNNPAPTTGTGLALSAGNDDRANITDAQWSTAITSFASGLGPGQVSAPGQTSATRHTQLVNACIGTNRVALLDLTDSPTPGTLIAAIPPYSESTRFAAAFAPWVIIPGLIYSSTRIVPPSAMIAGMIARNDSNLGTDAAAAGNQGVSNYAIGLSQPDYGDANRTTLNSNGVNIIRSMLGSIRNYGWRSLCNPATDTNWLDFGNARLFNDLSAEMEGIAENFVFQQITANAINQFSASLHAALFQHYLAGDLYGDTAEEAFAVNVGDDVNTPQTIQNLELHAIVQVRMTPFAEWVEIQVVKRQTADVITT